MVRLCETCFRKQIGEIDLNKYLGWSLVCESQFWFFMLLFIVRLACVFSVMYRFSDDMREISFIHTSSCSTFIAVNE